jgi:hypothetical protein
MRTRRSSSSSAVDKAKTDDVLNYAMDQVTDLYVGQNEWKKLAGHVAAYYNTQQGQRRTLPQSHPLDQPLPHQGPEA